MMLHTKRLNKSNYGFCEFDGCLSRAVHGTGGLKRAADVHLMWGDREIGRYCTPHAKTLQAVWQDAITDQPIAA